MYIIGSRIRVEEACVLGFCMLRRIASMCFSSASSPSYDSTSSSCSVFWGGGGSLRPSNHPNPQASVDQSSKAIPKTSSRTEAFPSSRNRQNCKLPRRGPRVAASFHGVAPRNSKAWRASCQELQRTLISPRPSKLLSLRLLCNPQPSTLNSKPSTLNPKP